MDVLHAKKRGFRLGRSHRNVLASWLTRWAPGFAATLLAIALHFLRFGYAYASGDQDELLSLVIHRLDSSLFANDWFVMSQSAGIGVRSYVVGLLTYLAQVMPIWVAVLVVHLASWFMVGMATYHLATLLTRSRLSGMVTMVIVLVFTPQWTLGGNDLIHNTFVPSSLSWGFALTGLLLHLRHRPAAAGGLLGIATLFQALVGLQVMLVVVWDLLLRLRLNRLRRQWVPTTFAIGSYAVVSAPILIPLILQQLGPDSGDSSFPSLFYIVAEFRNPHHYLPMSFPLGAWLKFAALAIAGGMGLFLLEQRHRLNRPLFIRRTAILLVLVLSTGFIAAEVLRILPVAKIQLFSMTVLWKIFFVGGAAGAAVHFWTAARSVAVFTEMRPFRTVLVLGALAASITLFAARNDDAVYKRVRPIAHEMSRLGQLEAWVRRSTPQDAIFLVPPSNTTFRPNAQRAIVVDFKAFPFEPELSRAWFNRLLAIAPIRLPSRGGASVLEDLDRAYALQAVERLVSVMERYEADYVLLPREIDPGDELQQVYRGGDWHLYRLNPAGIPRLAHRTAHHAAKDAPA